ncbi:hypothetical protein jhhlp_004136 [Lomentospora prolificans]|uniref:FHA domain-containing protein n=1 Tax=Lomentospora prolificans TaxID=41688 RepID=A0A2N3NAQ9_9PEZI|nr:hypothetical protein jhhlp_004136 [Lomentospora prolificans]
MTAVANPPSFPLNKPAWGGNGGQSITPMTEDVRAMFGRKGLQRSNSSSSISSNSSASSTTTVATTSSQLSGTPASSNGEVSQWPASTAPRKRPQSKGPWPAGKGEGHADLARMAGGRTQMMNGSVGGAPPMHQQAGGPPQNLAQQQGVARPLTDQMANGIPVLYLVSLNGTFERKTIQVPFSPDTLRIGRQTNQKTVPTPSNGYFDSKVLSRQHAEIWADRSGKIWIRDVKSSNGTFVNGTRLSQENRESEPHELQTADHLELGIDIVSEDQKTVVHHKVAAKVEHAGFNPSSNLLDMNFGDLDPANGNAMSSGQGTMHVRSRNGSNASVVSNGRIISTAGMMGPPANGAPHQRGYWVTPITAEQIVKRLQNEMRGARLQAQDLNRTGQFLSTLISKDEIKDLDKPDVPEPPKQQHIVNGNGIPFRADPKARFSDPPAPPPQHPLPEKPDIPSLKRGITERPKSHPSNTSPIRDNLSQILQLQEDLKNTKRELEGRDAKLRELEESLQKERLARESAEELARRLEESAGAATVVAMSPELDVVEFSEAVNHTHMNGSAKHSVDKALLEEAFEPPQEPAAAGKPDAPADGIEKSLADQAESTEAAASEYQARIDEMAMELRDMKEQLDLWRKRCETAESEREADRKTLSEMVLKIRQDEEARQASALAAAGAAAANREKSRGRSKNRRRSSLGQADQQSPSQTGSLPRNATAGDEPIQADGDVRDDSSDKPTLSRANTITPQKPPTKGLAQDQAIAAGLPYASMLGVVLLGMGLMAYINGWQTTPKLDR